MERKDGKVTAIIALFIGVIGLSIGFAALNTNLTINGSAAVQTSKWDIHFENLSDENATGNAAEVTAPTISNAAATSIGDYNVTLMTPGDTISYTFDIKNAGDYDAKISTITVPTPTCTGSGDAPTVDASNVCSNLTYSLVYTDTAQEVKKSDVLLKGATRNVTLKLAYSDTVTADLLPKSNVTISNLGITMNYDQN